ncbi:HEPN domain-containing protein [Xanthomonas arboricola]|uniref:HEPN domain-containing protein n=1 Tax=Xanthomonas arboricola TaxID=56448 RepID=UPI0011B090E4|nr:HEPN domain-containing protein [Xanthomonas arboricola]
MQPIEAFNDTHYRAMRLLRYHDGLINTRQRSIRSDWKTSFCKLMHWSQTHKIERVDSADAVLVLRDQASLTPDDFSSDALEDLLRSAITFGVSAIDRYVHERIVKAFVTAFRSSKLTKNQREFQVPATLAIEIVTRVHSANRTDHSIRPANEIRKVVQKTLHKRPFQSWREIEYGFSLIGVKDLGKTLRTAHSLSIDDLENLKNQLNKIVARRNQIVHEGDLPRHERGGQVYAQDIRRLWVEESLEFIEGFAFRLEAIA